MERAFVDPLARRSFLWRRGQNHLHLPYTRRRGGRRKGEAPDGDIRRNRCRSRLVRAENLEQRQEIIEAVGRMPPSVLRQAWFAYLMKQDRNPIARCRHEELCKEAYLWDELHDRAYHAHRAAFDVDIPARSTVPQPAWWASPSRDIQLSNTYASIRLRTKSWSGAIRWSTIWVIGLPSRPSDRPC